VEIYICGDIMWWVKLVLFFLSLEFSGKLLFFPVCGFALLVLVELRTLVSFFFAFGPFFSCYGRLVVFRCGVVLVCCSCGFLCSTNTKSFGLVVLWLSA
jgi:hypothetical protein